MKNFTRSLGLLIFLFFSKASFAQNNPNYTRSFLNNVVEIGLSDFGLITGEDSSHLYFIAVRRTVADKHNYPEKIAGSIKTAKFFNNTYRTKATKVSESKFGAFTIVLYESARPAHPTVWQHSYYFSLSLKKGKLSTFRDKWVSDYIWAILNARIEVLRQPKAGLVSLRVPSDAGIAKGMPLINSEGFIAGIVAESSLGKSTVNAIDMQAIANALYTADSGSCRYFSMVEWGKPGTRCVLEQLAKQAADEKAQQQAALKSKQDIEKTEKQRQDEIRDSLELAKKMERKTDRKQHFLDYGIHANILGGPLQAPGEKSDNYFKTRIMNVGAVLHLNIDKRGLYRLTLKPRYGTFYERNDPGLWTSPDQEVKIVISSYHYAELPVVFERQIARARNYSLAFGLGYSPGMIFDHQYTWIDKTATLDANQSIGGSAINHRLLAELHFYEFRIGRLSAVYAQDISGYPHKDYVLTENGTDYTPFANRHTPWYVGLELEIRLRGHWGGKW